jgi:hypothetical protein
MKIRPVGAKLFRADRQTDVTKLIVAFRNFPKTPKSRMLLILLINFRRWLIEFIVNQLWWSQCEL